MTFLKQNAFKDGFIFKDRDVFNLAVEGVSFFKGGKLILEAVRYEDVTGVYNLAMFFAE